MKKVAVEATVAAPIDAVWQAWNTPADIKQWNTASNDWRTTKSGVDLRGLRCWIDRRHRSFA